MDGGVRFRVWAPEQEVGRVVLYRPEGREELALERDDLGWFQATVPGAGPGDHYRYRFGSADPLPDPASRYQPEGVGGPSEVVDPHAFRWSRSDWGGRHIREMVIYEMHVGTFTPEGTFAAATERLPELAELGVTAVELMPVAEFSGERNWGYDGVFLFAPSRAYGRPDDLRAFVDRAHGHGIAVLLDVVYNHFGPEGNVLPAVTDGAFFTDEVSTPWGDAIDFSRRPVREFYLANARHWCEEYRIDGLRLDATHAIVDEGTPHILREIADAFRSAAGRSQVAIVAEDDRNERRLVTHPREGGYGLDGVWADDFHHSARRLTAGDAEGYFGDFSGTASELARAVTRGWLYEGQTSAYREAPRGTSPEGLPASAFVHCIQNHDQVGNRALGERLNHQIPLEVYRALSAVLLVSPRTPLLFMGQEWAASSPFLYFTDHPEELGRLVTEGRRKEFERFSAFSDPDARERIPDPQAEMTFRRSVLDWDESEEEPRAGVRRLYSDLLALRHEHPALVRSGEVWGRAGPIGEAALFLRRTSPEGNDLLLLACLSGEIMIDLTARPETSPGEERVWALRLATESPGYGGSGSWGRLEADGTVHIPAPGAVLLEARRHGSA